MLAMTKPEAELSSKLIHSLLPPPAGTEQFFHNSLFLTKQSFAHLSRLSSCPSSFLQQTPAMIL